jgi:hypothetical protein
MSHAALPLIHYSRNGFLKMLEGLTPEQLNTVPAGFNNNLIWNLGHVIAIQQQICYKRSGQNPGINDDVIETYSRGTKPNAPLSTEAIQWLKDEAVGTIKQLEKDLAADKFKDYPEYTITADNIPIKSIDDALNFIAFHESMHWGYAQALKRAVAA